MLARNRQVFGLALATAMAILSATSAVAEKRVGLVIGNDRYANLPPDQQLQKAVNDARAVGTVLEKLGFKVIRGENLDRRAMVDCLDDLTRQLEPGDTAFFFFAGHGVTVSGGNYILPVDVPNLEPSQETRLVRTALGENDIVADLQARGVRVAVVVLDACRNNPFKRPGVRSVGGERGLARTDTVRGVFTLYSAGIGQSALDRLNNSDPNPNSVFTRVLVPQLLKPGLHLGDLAFEVREQVARLASTVGHDQRPASYDETIGGRIYLAGLPKDNEPKPAPQIPAAAQTPPPAAQTPQAVPAPPSDEIAWEYVRTTSDLAALRRFVAEFPSSRRRPEAEARIVALGRERIAAAAPPVKPSVPVDVAPKPAVGVFPPGPDTGRAIKVGIMHSLSGTMAINETTLKDVMLFLIDEQNRKGGVLGRKLEAVVVDPASNWPLFAEKARELIGKEKVSVVFGGWTSISRKFVLPVFRDLNSILFYPVQYEGEESERNVFYTGAAPNQQAIPAADYLMKDEKPQRWVLAGTDFVYSRTTNKILEAYLQSKGVKPEDIMIIYTPFGHSDWQPIVADIRKFGAAGKKTAVVSTINGDANIGFYKELASQGVKPRNIPVVALSIGEDELAGVDTKPFAGHLAVGNYFQSIPTRENKEFIARWRAFVKNPKRATSDPMEAHVIGFSMWIEAVKKAGTADPDKVIDALPGIKAPNLTGGIAEMLPNHHITKPVFIGEMRADGQFDVVWNAEGRLVPGDAWSDHLPESKDIEADWVALKCGNYNVKTRKCGGS